MIFIKFFANQRKEMMFSLPQGAVSAWEAVALPGKFCPHLVPVLDLCEHRSAAANCTRVVRAEDKKETVEGYKRSLFLIHAIS